MKELFGGLEDMGFDDIEEIEFFKEKEAAKEVKKVVPEKPKELTYEDCVFERGYTCPVCDNQFKEWAAKATKARFIQLDDDLMPVYTPIYPFYYNVVICQLCGYAALAENFMKISDRQCMMIEKNITPKFKSITYTLPFTADVAIQRYKFALLNSMIKRARSGEKAYICLVISWLYKIKEDEANRVLFAKSAYESFVEAYSKDTFPLYGMNETVTSYLVAYLAMTIGEYEEAKRWISRVMMSRKITARLKDMTMALKATVLGLEERKKQAHAVANTANEAKGDSGEAQE